MNDLKNHFKTAQFLTHILENKFKIGNKKFGLEPILGLLPIWGDLMGLGLSLYIVWIGLRLKLPGEKISQMLGHVTLDFLIGLIPILGDLADFAYKANTRNLKILEEYITDEVLEAKVV